jgi:hypothetical protein
MLGGGAGLWKGAVPWFIGRVGGRWPTDCSRNAPTVSGPNSNMLPGIAISKPFHVKFRRLISDSSTNNILIICIDIIFLKITRHPAIFRRSIKNVYVWVWGPHAPQANNYQQQLAVCPGSVRTEPAFGTPIVVWIGITVLRNLLDAANGFVCLVTLCQLIRFGLYLQVASNGEDWPVAKEVVVAYYPSNFLEEPRNNSRCFGRDLKPEPPEYEGVLTTRDSKCEVMRFDSGVPQLGRA